MLEEVYQGFIDRTRRVLDIPTLKTIFGRKHRPHLLRQAGATTPRIERVLDGSVYDVTVFKVHFGRLTLKVYDAQRRRVLSSCTPPGRRLRGTRRPWQCLAVDRTAIPRGAVPAWFRHGGAIRA
jgi:hypothetical protein